MADTIGSLVDKLATVNNKLFVNQDLFYKIRAMTFVEFRDTYDSETQLFELWQFLQKMSDLNVQRNQLMSEVDLGIIALIKRAMAGEELDDGRSVQRAHKTGGEPAPILPHFHNNPPPGFAPCTRAWPHDGPCAHPESPIPAQSFKNVTFKCTGHASHDPTCPMCRAAFNSSK